MKESRSPKTRIEPGLSGGALRPADYSDGAPPLASVQYPGPGPSLDYIIGAGEDRRRNCEAERVGGLQFDCELEMCRLLDR